MLVNSRHKPKVSVLMPVYNAESFLVDAIESILQQTYKNFELIIVDDGSTDATPKILSAFAKKDSRIHVITNESNLGIVQALNNGLLICQGEYVVRMDADDISVHDRLSKQIPVLEKNPEIVVLGASLGYIDAEGKGLGIVRKCSINKSLLFANPLLHPTVVIRKKTLDKIGVYYQSKYLYAEDYFLWLRLSKEGKLDAIPDIVLNYRISGEATRVKQLKGVIWATLKVKWDAVFKLGIQPTCLDILRFSLESILLILPASLVLWLYMTITFGKNREVTL
jgi:glycosyltransferase involved in cell wall biosynthesis